MKLDFIFSRAKDFPPDGEVLSKMWFELFMDELKSAGMNGETINEYIAKKGFQWKEEENV